MNRLGLTSVLVTGLILLCVSIGYPYSGGSGDPDNPFQLSTPADWEELMAMPVDWESCFILTADIDLAGVIVTPVGDNDNPFEGVFDGNGHTISNAIIYQSGNGFVGLFGLVMTGGQILNLGVATISVTGSMQVGALAGQSYEGVITGCYATGVVNGQGSVGGLVGSANFGSISDCYAIVSVTGDMDVGGLAGVGYFGNFRNCFAAGPVSGAQYVGGFLGYDTANAIMACFWDFEASGTIDGVGSAIPDPFSVFGKSTGEMKTLATFTNLGWDFADETIDGTPAVWKMAPDSYPRLAWQSSSHGTYSGGTGTKEDPYWITSVADLLLLSASPADWNRAFILTTDLDLTGYVFDSALIAPDMANDNDHQGFDGTPFTGNFDGDFHTIAKFSIVDTTGADFLGLFGKIDDGGQVRNLILDNASITESGYESDSIGLLAGEENSGGITRCGVSGTIQMIGDNDYNFCWIIGGLVGNLVNGTINESYSSAGVLGGLSGLGGLVGSMTNGTVSDSYASGPVIGNFNVGGLAGIINSGVKIDKCYSVGWVKGATGGGLVGNADATPVTNSFWDVMTSNQLNSYGGTGLYTQNLMDRVLFEYYGWDFNDASIDGTPAVWKIRNGYDYPRLAWQSGIPGDIAGTTAVDLADLVALADAWAQTDCSAGCPADLNGDGKVDLADFAILAAHWLSQP